MKHKSEAERALGNCIKFFRNALGMGAIIDGEKAGLNAYELYQLSQTLEDQTGYNVQCFMYDDPGDDVVTIWCGRLGTEEAADAARDIAEIILEFKESAEKER